MNGLEIAEFRYRQSFISMGFATVEKIIEKEWFKQA